VKRLALGIVLVLGGCLHLLESSEVNRLTTCKNTDLKKIKKNLLLAGYEIKREDTESLTTDYKQVSGYGTDKSLQRITVVKLDDKDYKFNVRVKDKRVERNDQQYSNNNYGNKKKSGNTTNININMNQPIETENDYDQQYYKEHVGAYEQTHQQVCG
jgi:hypothetical protein